MAEDLYYDEDTLFKVRAALSAYSYPVIVDRMITAMFDAGILFRERRPADIPSTTAMMESGLADNEAFGVTDQHNILEQMNFNKGQAVSYICDAGIVDENPEEEIETLKTAIDYLQREIKRLRGYL